MALDVEVKADMSDFSGPDMCSEGESAELRLRTGTTKCAALCLLHLGAMMKDFIGEKATWGALGE